MSQKESRAYDPILDDPLSDSEEEECPKESKDDDGSSSEEGGTDVEFPREDADELMAMLHREFTNIQNMEDANIRKFALMRLYEIFVLAKRKATKQVYQEILPQI